MLGSDQIRRHGGRIHGQLLQGLELWRLSKALAVHVRWGKGTQFGGKGTQFGKWTQFCKGAQFGRGTQFGKGRQFGKGTLFGKGRQFGKGTHLNTVR